MAQTVTPLPSIGDVVPGRDVPGRELRISGHPESDRVVLSIWQDGRCQATVRLARADVPEVTRALVAGLVPVPQQPDANRGPTGTVHQLRTNPSATTNPSSATNPSVATSIGALTDRIATTVIARLRKFRS
jgi:hypothetical protein